MREKNNGTAELIVTALLLFFSVGLFAQGMDDGSQSESLTIDANGLAEIMANGIDADERDTVVGSRLRISRDDGAIDEMGAKILSHAGNQYVLANVRVGDYTALMLTSPKQLSSGEAEVLDVVTIRPSHSSQEVVSVPVRLDGEIVTGDVLALVDYDRAPEGEGTLALVRLFRVDYDSRRIVEVNLEEHSAAAFSET